MPLRQVQAPEMTIPTNDQFFSMTDRSKPNIAFLKNHFYREGRLKEEHALYIIDKATQLLRREPNVLSVDAPVTGAAITFFFCTLTFPHLVSDTFFIAVCGDIRGQYVRISPLNPPTDRTTHTRRDRSMTSCSCSISEASCRILATSSWVTTSAKPILASKCAAPGSSFLYSCDSGHVVCAISMGAQNLVPRLVLPSSWEPRV